MDLPEPDSPTTQRICPGIRSKETSSTASGRSPPAGRVSFSPRIATAGAVISAPLSGETRIERVIQAFADEVERQHGQQDGGAGEARPEEHTSDLRPLMRTSYAVFRLKNKPCQNEKQPATYHRHHNHK